MGVNGCTLLHSFLRDKSIFHHNFGLTIAVMRNTHISPHVISPVARLKKKQSFESVLCLQFFIIQL